MEELNERLHNLVEKIKKITNEFDFFNFIIVMGIICALLSLRISSILALIISLFHIAAIILVIYIVYMMKNNMEFIDHYGKTWTLVTKILCICSLNPTLIYIAFVLSSNAKTK